MNRIRVSAGMAALVVATGLATTMGGLSRAGETPANADAALPIDRAMMQRVANFTLKDVTTGRTKTLYGYQGKKAIVLVFMGVDCPVGNLYTPRLIELSREYLSKGVVFLGISSNAHEPEGVVAKYVRETGIDFPVLKDPGNQIADAMLALRTPEVLVLDGMARIRYRGAIDDQYGKGTNKGAPAREYLRDALEAVLKGGEVKVKATEVAGCLLDRIDPVPPPVVKAPRVRPAVKEVAAAYESRDQDLSAATGPVTYSSHVAEIVQNKCASCHRPGQVGPFSLLTYDDARKHSAMIKEVVAERRMPPWHADPRFGHFANDRSLSARDRAVLLSWVDQGTPLGDPAKIPAPRKFQEGWTIGKPDMVFELPETYYVPAQGVVSYVHFKVPTGFTEDRWVQAAEAVPGDRSVVHHIVVYLLDSRRPPGGGRPKPIHFCGYAPGEMPSVYPDGTAKKIPVGYDLLFQVHYTPNGRVRSDRSKVGLVFAKGEPKRQAFTLGIANPDLLIPANADNVAVASSFELPAEARLLSFLPHMHLRGKDFRYSVTRPGQKTEVVLSVPAYDFGWQTYYSLAEPLVLPKGSRIDCLAHFDNSTGNPFNPNPNQLVKWGEQTFEEMMIGYIDMDVPLSTPTFNTPDLAPRSVKATLAAVQALRKMVGGGDKPKPEPAKPAAR
jgi:peroxiredoxin/mono/diheme cytochrome c family protein